MMDTATFEDRTWERDTYSNYEPSTGPIRVYFMRWYSRQYHDLPDIDAARAFCEWLCEEYWDGEGWQTWGAPEHIIDTRTGENIEEQMEVHE